MGTQSYEFETEAQKRRERRHAKAAREREGHRRRKEGLPRNYLLVDEYTKRPYGVGVGDWRKEVMLLSRKLDPAIGLISKQPHDALLEIGEWINQTWEYSNPMKFEVVKEVIARGVSLRRAELWRKIRNSEPKPPDVSDRTWRSLKRELENPAMIRKSQSCSKANASRVNFGRTGPSGEVGVRERLRKRLKRSPEPEEIRFEMARDKGYGGQSRKKKVVDKVMHGSEVAPPLSQEVGPILDGFENTIDDTNEDDCNPPVPGGSPPAIHDNIAGTARPATVNTACGRGQPMAEEDLASNPLVLKLLERIAALEGHHSPVAITVPSVPTEELPATVTDEPVQHADTSPHAEEDEVSISCHSWSQSHI